MHVSHDWLHRGLVLSIFKPHPRCNCKANLSMLLPLSTLPLASTRKGKPKVLGSAAPVCLDKRTAPGASLAPQLLSKLPRSLSNRAQTSLFLFPPLHVLLLPQDPMHRFTLGMCPNVAQSLSGNKPINGGTDGERWKNG